MRISVENVKQPQLEQMKPKKYISKEDSEANSFSQHERKRWKVPVLSGNIAILFLEGVFTIYKSFT